VSLNFDPSDPPGPLTVVRAILGGALVVATLLLLVLFFESGHLDPRFVALVGALWLFWGVFHDVLGFIVQPLAGLLGDQLTGTAPPAVPHREILAGIRLAEIYRTHQRDPAKSAALLARLRAKYPDAPELQHGDGAA